MQGVRELKKAARMVGVLMLVSFVAGVLVTVAMTAYFWPGS